MGQEIKQDPQQSQRKLKNVLIHKPLQREYTMLMVIVLMVATLLIGVVIHFTIQESMMGDRGGLNRAMAYDLFSEMDQKLLIRVFGVLLVTIVAAIASGVFFLHRVAGPIYRIRVTLKKIADMHIPSENVHLRRGDFFQEVAIELNRVLERMRREHPDRVVGPSNTDKSPK